MRADCAPSSTLGSGGVIGVADWVACGNYAGGIFPITPVGGPGTPDANPALVVSIGATTFAVVEISPAAVEDQPSNCSKCNEFQPSVVPPVLEDQGQCAPPPSHKTCNTEDLPNTACKNEVYVTQYNPDSAKRFTVVASLKDQTCSDILDQSDRTIITVIQ
jgi:hypothetical protein